MIVEHRQGHEQQIKINELEESLKNEKNNNLKKNQEIENKENELKKLQNQIVELNHKINTLNNEKKDLYSKIEDFKVNKKCISELENKNNELNIKLSKMLTGANNHSVSLENKFKKLKEYLILKIQFLSLKYPSSSSQLIEINNTLTKHKYLKDYDHLIYSKKQENIVEHINSLKKQFNSNIFIKKYNFCKKEETFDNVSFVESRSIILTRSKSLKKNNQFINNDTKAIINFTYPIENKDCLNKMNKKSIKNSFKEENLEKQSINSKKKLYHLSNSCTSSLENKSTFK